MFEGLQQEGIIQIRVESVSVDSATVNGIPCTIEQYSSTKEVTDHCKKRSEAEKVEFSLPGAFALAYLRYDEAAAKAAATETVTEKGVEYPVIVLRLKCSGTLPNGKQVEELAMLTYYINGRAPNVRDAEGGVPYKDAPVSAPPVGSQWTWLGVSL